MPVCIPKQKQKVKPMKAKEYYIANAGRSWKFRMINAIEYAMKRAKTKQQFIDEMDKLGYEMRWTPTRKNITYIEKANPNHKCRDDNLHEEKFLKEKMEEEFEIRERLSSLEREKQPNDFHYGESGIGNDSRKRLLESVDTAEQKSESAVESNLGESSERRYNQSLFSTDYSSTEKEDNRTRELNSETTGKSGNDTDRTGWEDEREYAFGRKTDERSVERTEEEMDKDVFDKVQYLLENKKKSNVRASSNKPYHRYTGLIKCGDCGASFSCKTRKFRDREPYSEYVCNSYHRYGKEHCSPYRIKESVLDKIIYDELLVIRDNAIENFKQIDAKLNTWQRNKSLAQNNIALLNEQLSQRKSDQQEILLERLRDKERADVYTQMLEKCESDIETLSKRIAELEDMDNTIKKRKAEISSSIEIFNKIIDEGTISDSDLRMLIDKIEVSEINDKLDINIILNGKFKEHTLNFDEVQVLNLVS